MNLDNFKTPWLWLPPILLVVVIGLALLLGKLFNHYDPVSDAIVSWIMPILATVLTWSGLLFSYEAKLSASNAETSSKSAEESANAAAEAARYTLQKIGQGVTIHQEVVPAMVNACDEVERVIEKLNISEKIDRHQKILFLLLTKLSSKLKVAGQEDTADQIKKIEGILCDAPTVAQAKDCFRQMTDITELLRNNTDVFVDSLTSTQKEN